MNWNWKYKLWNLKGLKAIWKPDFFHFSCQDERWLIITTENLRDNKKYEIVFGRIIYFETVWELDLSIINYDQNNEKDGYFSPLNIENSFVVAQESHLLDEIYSLQVYQKDELHHYVITSSNESIGIVKKWDGIKVRKINW